MIVKNLVVTNGEYTTRGGETKRRYLTIGQLHEHEGRQYITLDAHINLAGLARKDGETRVFANLYDPLPKGQENDSASPRAENRPSRGVPRQPSAEDFDDEVPFMRPISPDGLCMPGDTGAWFGPHFSPWTLGA